MSVLCATSVFSPNPLSRCSLSLMTAPVFFLCSICYFSLLVRCFHQRNRHHGKPDTKPPIRCFPIFYLLLNHLIANREEELNKHKRKLEEMMSLNCCFDMCGWLHWFGVCGLFLYYHWEINCSLIKQDVLLLNNFSNYFYQQNVLNLLF